MQPADLEKELAAGRWRPIYLLHGLEHKQKERMAARLAETVPEGLRDFNLHSLSADETSPAEVLGMALTMAFMSPPRVIILRGVDRYEAEDLKPFKTYLDDPNETTCLVLLADKPDFRIAFFRNIKKQGLDVAFAPPRGQALLRWVREAMKQRGQDLPAEAAQALVDQLGDDLMELEAEIEKVSLYAYGRNRVETEDVRAAARVGPTANVFQLGDALSSQNQNQALQALDEVLLREPHMKVLAMLVRHFRLLLKAKLFSGRPEAWSKVVEDLKLISFVANKYRDQCRGFSLEQIKTGLRRLQEANLRLVTSSAPERLVMERLVLDLASLRTPVRSGL